MPQTPWDALKYQKLAGHDTMFEQEIKNRFDTMLRIGWMIVIAIFLVSALSALVGVLGRDEAAFVYVAKGILNGEVPYTDRWDQKGPAIYALSLVGVLIDDLWGVRLLAGIFLLGSAATAYRLIRGEFGGIAASFAVVVLLVYYVRLEPGNLTEHYALLFQFLTLQLFADTEHRGDVNSWRPFAIGVLGAAAFLLRPNLVGIWLAVGIYWMIRGTQARWWLWHAIAGGLTALGITAAALLAVGGLASFWDACFSYNYHAYAYGTPLIERLWVIRHARTAFIAVSLLVLCGWVVGLVLVVFRDALPESRRHLVSVALILLPLELALVSVSGYSFPHYFAALLPVVVVLVSFAVWFIVERRFVVPAFLSVVLLLGTAYHYSAYDVVPRMTRALSSDNDLDGDIRFEFAQRIRAATRPGDSVLVWGFQPLVHLLSERDSPSRYFYQFPLMMPGYTSQDLIDGFVADVVTNAPAMILDIRDRRLPPLDGVARSQWRPADRYLDDGSLFQTLFDLIDAKYELVAEHRGWVLYKLSTDDAIDHPIDDQTMERSTKGQVARSELAGEPFEDRNRGAVRGLRPGHRVRLKPGGAGRSV